MRPYILAETNWKAVQDTQYDVVVLPWGATEAHNYHLPYATDNYQVEHVAAETARIAWDSGAKVLVLPCIPFGINTGQLDIPFCMNLNPSTQLAILKDVVDVLVRHDIVKFVIMNGHGGNNFKNMIRELSFYYPEIFVCAVSWWDAAKWKDYFEDLGDHAGELETSVMQYIEPELVLPLQEAGRGHARRYKIEALRDGWAMAQRQWTKVSKDTGVGNPYKATPEKGRIFLDAVNERIAKFLIELAETELEEMYE